MGKSSQATQAKRNRERARQQFQKEKRDQKALKKEIKKTNPDDPASDEDPDLAGIVPGPQPIYEY